MSLMKKCSDMLEYGSKDQKYQAANFLIRSKVERDNLDKVATEKLIHHYCTFYPIEKKKLTDLVEAQ